MNSARRPLPRPRAGAMMVARLLITMLVCGFSLCDKASALTLGHAPWCAVAETSPGNMEWDCDFQSAAECAPHVVAGNRGFCNMNPYWQPPPASYVRAKRAHRKHVPRQ
jgi:hypothetical protein